MGLIKRLDIPGEIGKEPELHDPLIILGYMEELALMGSEVHFQTGDPNSLPLRGKVELAREEGHLIEIALSRALPGEVKKHDKFMLYFPIERMRFKGEISFVSRSGYMKATFEMPSVVLHDERRTTTRIYFTPREKAYLTALENLTSGHGIKGRLVDVSLGGAAVRVDTAIAVNTQRRIKIDTELFSTNAELAFVRVNNLPSIPMLECRGQVTHLSQRSIGIVLGLRFTGMDPLDVQLLNQTISKRLASKLPGFPIRYPKSKREERRKELEGQAQQDREKEESWENPESDQDVDFPLPKPLVTCNQPTSTCVKDKLQVIKKRGKQIMVIMRDDLDRMIVAGTLQVDGYLRIGEARNFLEALAWLKNHRTDLVIIEEQLGSHPASVFIQKLRDKGYLENVPILMLTNGEKQNPGATSDNTIFDKVLQYPLNYDGIAREVLLELLKIS